MDDPRRWFHVTVTTYGAWIRGDARGFRTRHHREHVEGDYKSPPPPGTFDALNAYSRGLQRAPTVVLSPDVRRLVTLAMRERLEWLGDLVVAAGMGGCHGHVLAKIIPALVDEHVGYAKRHAHFTLYERGRCGKLWAKRCGVTPGKGPPASTVRAQLHHAPPGPRGVRLALGRPD